MVESDATAVVPCPPGARHALMTCTPAPANTFAGTAIRHLRDSPELAKTAVFFVRHIRDTHTIPSPRTSSAAEQFAAFETFMSAEADRVDEAAKNPD